MVKGNMKDNKGICEMCLMRVAYSKAMVVK